MAIEKLKFLVSADTKNFTLGMKAIAVAAAAAFAAAIKVTADFEKQISRLGAISQSSSNDLKAMEIQAKKLGSTTASTAREIVQLQTELAKLGFTTREIIAATPAVRDFADALESGLAESAALAGNVLNQFGLDASETGRVVDVLSKASISSALDFEKLRESMKVAGPAAASLNIPLEETVAVLATLADLGISGSLGGTAFKKFVSSAAKSGRTVTEVFEDIATSADPAARSIKLLGDRTFGAGIALAKSQGKLEELVKLLKDAEGTTKAIAEQKLDNLSGDVTKMKSAWEGLSIEIGEIFTPILRVLVKALTKFITWVHKLIINIKLLFKKTAQAVLILVTDLLEGVKTFREWLGLDTSKLDNQIKGLKDRVKELNDEIDILNGKKIELDSGKPKTKENPIGTQQVRNTSSVNAGLTPDEIQSFLTGGPNPAEGSVFNKDGAALRDKEYQKYLAFVEQVEKVNDTLSDSFSDLGNNISNSLSSSMGVFGAFLGTVIQGLLDLAAQAITSAITTAVTEKAKQGAYGATAQAAAIAAAAESAAGAGPAGIALLPVFIGAALAAVAAGLSGTGGKVSGSPGAAVSPATSTTTTPRSIQGNGAGGSLVATVRGQDLRFILQAADDSYGALS